jgi:hypothetical protein
MITPEQMGDESRKKCLVRHWRLKPDERRGEHFDPTLIASRVSLSAILNISHLTVSESRFGFLWVLRLPSNF